MSTYSIKVVESGFINKTLTFPLPVESALVTELEDGLEQANVELDGSITITKNGHGGFNVVVSLSVDNLAAKSFDLTEPAMGGLPGFLEGVVVGSGKTYAAKITLVKE